MKILLIAVGKTDSVELDSLIGEYVKRLARYADFSIQVITDVKNSRNMPGRCTEATGRGRLF